MTKEKLSTCAAVLDFVISINFSPPVEASRRSRHRGFAQDPSTICRSYGADAEVAEVLFSLLSADPPQRLAGRPSRKMAGREGGKWKTFSPAGTRNYCSKAAERFAFAGLPVPLNPERLFNWGVFN